MEHNKGNAGIIALLVILLLFAGYLYYNPSTGYQRVSGTSLTATPYYSTYPTVPSYSSSNSRAYSYSQTPARASSAGYSYYTAPASTYTTTTTYPSYPAQQNCYITSYNPYDGSPITTCQ
ncbi:MAG TPA: hypothetical protein VGO63_03460 [Candidatus Paceibacterota bacterium]|nr:hypothetical protein [Candidatus Paceibacterota bacterium]